MSAGLIACLFAMAAPAAAFLPSQLPSSLLRVQRRHTAIAPGMVLGKGTALVYDEKHSKHSGFMHPEHPQRVTESWNLLQSSGLASQCKEIEARQATVEEMGSIHTLEYLDDLMNGSPTMDESTYFHKGKSSIAAATAAGSVAELTHQVCRGESTNGFAVTRPPGHHAERTHAMGFCLVNNVAVAAQLARTNWGCERVLVFDWDVHHGNGIQNAFYQDPSVLYISIHRGGVEESGFFPGTGLLKQVGEAEGKGYTVNIPLEMEGTGDAVYEEALNSIVLPVARAFKPSLVLVSAGFDAAAGDPLGGFLITPKMFGKMTRMLQDVAAETADGRLVLALEGGYNPEVTAECVSECTRVLLGGESDYVPTKEFDHDFQQFQLAKIRKVHAENWGCLS